MNPAELRAICDSLNDERGTGGQSRLARLLGWNFSTVWRKLNGKSLSTESDALWPSSGPYRWLKSNNGYDLPNSPTSPQRQRAACCTIAAITVHPEST
ncbi:helix-turn-helix domain-containing protein [Tautonia rosea]|uniref:helix-turn-helix domain-containing protein n=1 Tax=Tautonia rosea TaxID=2728037 RepID=UPI00147624F3|nr:helix-turn-helix domain-containing protein [Tautonia rosea]